MKAPVLDLINYDPSKDYLIPPDKLAMWAKHKMNVLFIGETGVGKTAIIMSFFEQLGLRCKYFSAPTLEPYIDIIGVPREHTDADGNTFLEFIQKREFAKDEIDVVFIDEFNRARPEVRNAVMEFVQFKSINGKKYHNLKMVWAAINPYDEDGTYDVDRLDPAMMGRFPIKHFVDNRPCPAYFEAVFGKYIADTSIEWWTKLTTDHPNTLALVPPRTLHDAVSWYLLGGDVRDVMPKDTNINCTEFVTTLAADPIEVQVEKLFTRQDQNATKAFLNTANTLFRAKSIIESKEEWLNYFLPLARPEVISGWARESEVVLDNLVRNINIGPNRSIIDDFINFQPDLKPKIKQAWVTTPFIQDPAYRVLTEKIVFDINLACSEFYVSVPTGKVNYSFTERLIALKVKTNNFEYKNDQDKAGTWTALCAYVPGDLSEDDAKFGLYVMDTLASAKLGFLAEFDKSVSLLNTFAATLYFKHGYTPEQIWKICPHVEQSNKSLTSAKHTKSMFLK